MLSFVDVVCCFVVCCCLMVVCFSWLSFVGVVRACVLFLLLVLVDFVVDD